MLILQSANPRTCVVAAGFKRAFRLSSDVLCRRMYEHSFVKINGTLLDLPVSA